MISEAEPINVNGHKKMVDPQEGTSSGIVSLVCRPPLDCAVLSARLVWQFLLFCTRINQISNDPSGKAKMEIIAVREREHKLKQKVQMTASLVRTGVNRFRVTDNRYYNRGQFYVPISSDSIA